MGIPGNDANTFFPVRIARAAAWVGTILISGPSESKITGQGADHDRRIRENQ
jgi:hypothetical protein